MKLLPTQAGLRSMQKEDLQWGDVLWLLEQVEREQPDGRDPEKRLLISDAYNLVVAVGWDDYERERVFYLTRVINRHYEKQRRTVFAEPTVPKQRKKGGSGRTMPKTFAELIRMVEEAEGWTIEVRGLKYCITAPCGQKCFLMSKESGDLRAVKNATSTLRKLGLDIAA